MAKRERGRARVEPDQKNELDLRRLAQLAIEGAMLQTSEKDGKSKCSQSKASRLPAEETDCPLAEAS